MLFINAKEYHYLIHRNDKCVADKFYQILERKPGYFFKTWCLPFAREHGLDKWEVWQFVQQTENLFIFPVKDKLIIYRKSDITEETKSADEIKPIVLKGYKYLHAEGNIIELNKDKGRVLYDAEN